MENTYSLELKMMVPSLWLIFEYKRKLNLTFMTKRINKTKNYFVINSRIQKQEQYSWLRLDNFHYNANSSYIKYLGDEIKILCIFIL